MQDAEKPVDREMLYNEVWTEPVSLVAPRYGLSDVGLAKICRSLAIPIPSRGYWAKVKAGRKMGRVPLPTLKNSGTVRTGLVKLPSERVAIREAARKVAAQVREEMTPVPATEEPSALHPLIRAASKRLRKRDGWPENTLLRSAPKEVFNLSVTKRVLDRALAIADTLVKALVKQGFDFEVDPEHGVTRVVWLKTGTKMDLSLTEYVQKTTHQLTRAEKHAQNLYWAHCSRDRSISYPNIPHHDFSPTGILTIQVGRWPFKSWKDTPKTQLEKRLGQVTGGILVLAQEVYAKEQEEARRKEAYRRAVERYEFLTARRAKEVKRFEQLETSASNWERAAKLRTFACALEAQAKADGELSAEKVEQIAWVRAKADWLDPFILVSDPVLDAPEPSCPNYW